ncbi:MAG: lipase maturation factor family protein [Verrucomicrobia bacterium]|nr:lipase maturation factor family protein [Verrucomicrobiota bacterium]
MNTGIRVKSPPEKPLIVFDGDCGFCTLWVRRWEQTTAGDVQFLPSQDPTISERFPEIPKEKFETSVQLVQKNGEVYSGSEAVFRGLAEGCSKWPLRFYEKVPGFAPVSEAVYGMVSRNRQFFSALTRLMWGKHVERPTYFLTRWIFLRLLAMIYFVAFLSLLVQVPGLLGGTGILPAADTMESLSAYMDREGVGVDRYRIFPTLSWFNVSDGFLQFQCWAGMLLAGLLFSGVAPPLCLFLLWVLYLSLTTIAREFTGFQWDSMLLEVGFLSIFFAPRHWLPGFIRETPPSRIVHWLLRWVLFRLMFQSGLVKLASGDPTWRDFTALRYHYETQPLPTLIGWYVHQMPLWFHQFCVGAMFAVQLVIPFFIFAPRRLRIFAVGAFVALEVLIASTGNYGFFNFLTLSLCLLLLDDFDLQKWVHGKWRERLDVQRRKFAEQFSCAAKTIAQRIRKIAAVLLLLLFLFLTIPLLARNLKMTSLWPEWMSKTQSWFAPFRSVNTYGLFAVMTTNRPEIIIEGSNDGKTWQVYEFKYKPGDLQRAPGFNSPHQPRLDWQMWFAALGSYQQNQWFLNFCQRLLQGSPEVVRLLEKNPFPDQPPKLIRATVYDYRFTDIETRRRTGQWWQRTEQGLYCPVLLLEGDSLRALQ